MNGGALDFAEIAYVDGPMAAVFFIVFILLIQIVLLNVLLAILVSVCVCVCVYVCLHLVHPATCVWSKYACACLLLRMCLCVSDHAR